MRFGALQRGLRPITARLELVQAIREHFICRSRQPILHQPVQTLELVVSIGHLPLQTR